MKRLILVLIIGIILSGCVQDKEIIGGNETVQDEGGTRDFYIGVVPTPKSDPETTFEDINNAYEELGEIAEVSMVWVQPQGIGQYEKLKENKVVTALEVYGVKPILTLQFATIKETDGGLEYMVSAPEGVNGDLSDPEFRELWVEEAKRIAQEFKPEYFSLGNEINDYFYLNPEQLEDYISLYQEAYSAIKEVSPNTKVFVVFSYTHMRDNDQYWMLGEFNDKVDLVGITSYPWKHYESPEDIPEDYYSKITEYTDKPIAFTEIGWPNPEKEQAEFLSVFLERIKGLDVEMVNWLFLHEVELGGITGSVSEEETGTIALKYSNGEEKEVYKVWKELKNN